MPKESQKSRNHGGRRPGAGRKESETARLRREFLARQHRAAVTAFEFAEGVVSSADAPTPLRLQAAEIVMARVWGKPVQAVAVGIPDEDGALQAGTVTLVFGRPGA